MSYGPLYLNVCNGKIMLVVIHLEVCRAAIETNSHRKRGEFCLVEVFWASIDNGR